VSTVPAYSDFDVIEIPLEEFMDEWLPGLEADGLRIGLSWTGPRATGYDIEPRSVRAALDATSGT
jgi:Protein of unknown function (DUF2750)